MKDSAFYNKIVIDQATQHKALVSHFNSPLINKILSSEEFYFDKVRSQFNSFKKLDTKLDLNFAIEELNRYQEKIYPALENLLEETYGSSLYELYLELLSFLIHVDDKTAVSSRYNVYDEPRFITKTNLPQITWMTELIKFKQYNELNNINPYVANTIKFIEQPENYSSIVSEEHKKKITINLFKLQYDKNLFEERLELFIRNTFPKISALSNQLNKHVLFTEIIYTRELREVWDVPTSEEKEITYDKNGKAITDAAALKDKLGREQLVKTIIKCTEDIFSDERIKDPYTILLNGEWGSGKSSLLNFLRVRLEKNLYTIIDYNAWENQSFKDPWWILINAVSKKATKENLNGNFHSHRYWRFKMLYKHQFWAGLAIVVFLISTYYLTITGDEPASFTFIISLIGLVSSFVAAITGLVNNFFYNDVSKEELKHRFSEHPFQPIQARFNEIAEANNLAIFIDDLDRCDVQTTVKVMEGIQNLFKGQRVLYIIAADGKWVSNCFNEQYKSFQNLGTLGCSVGDRFLQKCIQLSVNVPKLANNYYHQYGNEIIGFNGVKESSATSAKEKESSSSEEAPEYSGKKSGPDDQENAETSKTKSQADVVLEDKEKYLKKFIAEKYLPTNPRQLKRFMNQYIVMREILSIEGTLENYDKGDSNEDKSIRFLIFALEFPSLKEKIRLGYISIDDIVNYEGNTALKLQEKEISMKDIGDIKRLIGKENDKITNDLIRGDFFSI